MKSKLLNLQRSLPKTIQKNYLLTKNNYITSIDSSKVVQITKDGITTYTIHVNTLDDESYQFSNLVIKHYNGVVQERILHYNPTIEWLTAFNIGERIPYDGGLTITDTKGNILNSNNQNRKAGDACLMNIYIPCYGATCPCSGDGQYFTLVFKCGGGNDSPPRPNDPPGNENGGGGGGSPGGGGISEPEGIPTDPQTGDPIGPPITPPEMPCLLLASNDSKANALLKNSNIKNKVNDAAATIDTDTNEKAFSYGKRNSDQQLVASAITQGTQGKAVTITTNSSTVKIQGAFHTHYAGLYNSFSAGDFYAFRQANLQNSSFESYYAIAEDKSIYSLSITNPHLFKNFALTYPRDQYIDPNTNDWKENSSIGKEYNDIKKQLIAQGKNDEEAFELANAFVLKKYNTGMSISKASNVNSNFSPIFVEEVTIPVRVGSFNLFLKVYNKATNCNL